MTTRALTAASLSLLPLVPAQQHERAPGPRTPVVVDALTRAPAPPEAAPGSRAAHNPWPTRLEDVPPLNLRYATPESRARTVAILGASSSREATAAFEPWARELAKSVVAAGGNVVSGCGTKAIMGAAFDGAYEASQGPGAGENLTIIKRPAWGDEDLTRGRAIGVADSEPARLDKFFAVAGTIVAFPGGAGTFIEIAQSLFNFAYPSKDMALPERFVLVGGAAYWAGIKLQLETMVAAQQLKPEVASRFVFVDDRAGVLAQGTPSALR